MMSLPVLQQIAEQFFASSALELAAVMLAVIYLLLVVKEDIRCWYAAFLSTAIFLVIFWDVNLYMESGLQIYYLLMAVFGWYQWRAIAHPEVDALPISRWSKQNHFLAIFAVITASVISGYLLSTNTDASLPYLDSFTTWASVITTYMVAKKVYENWAYWLVIDTVSIYLYLDRGLYFTSLLFLVYLIIIGFGWYSWSQKLSQQPSSA